MIKLKVFLKNSPLQLTMNCEMINNEKPYNDLPRCFSFC